MVTVVPPEADPVDGLIALNRPVLEFGLLLGFSPARSRAITKPNSTRTFWTVLAQRNCTIIWRAFHLSVSSRISVTSSLASPRPEQSLSKIAMHSLGPELLTKAVRSGAADQHIQLTTDAFIFYTKAVERSFGGDVDYAQLKKLYGDYGQHGNERYSPSPITEVISRTISGVPNPAHVSTSYIERQNLTVRMGMRIFTRLTNAFSKRLENLKAACALHFAHYNFCRVHSSLRVTPAMAAGISSEIFPLSALL
jgi:hypothetical protein